MNTQPEALRLADAIQLAWLENVDADKADIDMIQTELRRLHEELQEQCRINGMGAEREARLTAVNQELVKVLNLALEALENWWEFDPENWGDADNKAITAIREALADSTLDRMAENARELGLDYEPPCKTGSQCTSKCPQCEQPEAELKATERQVEILSDELSKCSKELAALKTQQQELVVWKDEQGNVRMTLDAGDIQSSVGYVYSVNGERIKNACIRSDIPNGTPLYTFPQSKPWAGLTQEERDYIWHTVGNSDAHGDVDGWSGRDVMDAIEAKLKEKNSP